jgi:hypothetical protein
VIVISALLLILASISAWAGNSITVDNKSRNNVYVRFITINPNSIILNSPEELLVNANSVISHNLKDPCIYEIYINGSLRMSPKVKTGLGLGCFNLTGSNYTLIIEPDGSVKLQ